MLVYFYWQKLDQMTRHRGSRGDTAGDFMQVEKPANQKTEINEFALIYQNNINVRFYKSFTTQIT